MLSAPRTQRKLAAAVMRATLNAEPLVLRHRLQWQVCIGLTLPAISNAAAPHRQLPPIKLGLESKGDVGGKVHVHRATR